MRATPSYLALIIFLICGFACADEEVDLLAGTGRLVGMPETPDHLVPINPHPAIWKIAYNKQLTKHLGLDENYLARMMVMPSFGAEYSMRVNGDAMSIESSKEFLVTYTISNESIWSYMSDNNSEKNQMPIEPKTFTASIPAETARRVCVIWDEMILRTQYTRGGGGGLDGNTIEFASRYGHGETWSPAEGTSPQLLQALGERLIAYCKAPTEERKKFLEAVQSITEKLEIQLKQKAGADQPATAPELKSGDNEKPNPESEVRPQ